MAEATKAVFEAMLTTDPPVRGTVTAHIVEVGKDGTETDSNHIIRTDRDWKVRVHWSLEGALVPCLCGTWCLQLFLESVGPGEELFFPAKNEKLEIPLDPCGDGNYWQDINIPAHRIREEHCSIPYKPVVALTYLDGCYRPGPMAGFVELPIVQFYPVEKPGQ